MKLLHYRVMVDNQPVKNTILEDGNNVVISTIGSQIVIPKKCFDKAYQLLKDYDTVVKAYSFLDGGIYTHPRAFNINSLLSFFGYFSKYNIMVKVANCYYYFGEQLNGKCGEEEELKALIIEELTKIGVL